MARKKKRSEGKKDRKEEINKSEDKENCEIFEVEKNGKEEVKKFCGDELESKPATKEQIKKENKLLRNILIGLAIFVILLLLGVWFVSSSIKFEYQGMKFKMIKEGDLLFYTTSFPVYSNRKKIADYNVYLRNDPRKLDEIPFIVEDIEWKEIIILNSTNSFNCDGNGIISIANLAQVLESQSIKIGKDPNATCDKAEEFIFIQMQEADVSEIKQIDSNCFEFNVNNCEILEVTERFLLEAVKDITEKSK